MRFRIVRLLMGLALIAFLLLGPALFVSADDGVAGDDRVVVAQEEAPYTPPEINAVEVPDWLEPLEPLARLPLWGQAAVLSAGVAGLFFVLPLVFKWVWNLGEDPTERNGGSRP
ncbi:MAG TPA: hypothetical protein VLA91_05515 [Acidimicrobiia bacterium]|nr:hypothetical protein [Acidimicrobiia bacterium]